MEFIVKTNQNKKIGCFTDLHVGVSSDNKIRLNETMKCFHWIIEKFKNENVDYVIFLGDLFNSRYSVNVNTLNIGIEIVSLLSENFEYLFLIAGNHDVYYKNTNEVNSVSFLEKISANENIFVIDNEAKFIKINETIIGLYPWAYDKEKLKEIKDYQIPNFGFGHFEFNGAELTGSISKGSKYNLADLFDFGKILFSGHYHGNKTYQCLAKNSYLYMIGSPLQLDWGDYGKEKKIITFSSDETDFKEFTNNVNSKFEKVFYSDFKKNSYNEKTLKKLCSKNFVKFVIDSQYTFESILKITGEIKNYNPISLELDYLISIANNTISESADEMIKAKSKTNKDYLIEYIDVVFEEYKKIDAQLDLIYLKTMAALYFDKASLSKIEQKNDDLILEGKE